VLLTVFLTCVAIELLLVWLDYSVNYGRWTRIGAVRRLVNIPREDGLAGWFQPVQTLLVAGTAGIGCFVVAVGLDFVEGLPRRHPLNVQTWAVERFDFHRFSRRRFGRSATAAAAHFSKSIEETLEEFGTTLLCLAFLQHLMSRSGELRLRFAPTPSSAAP
jgi:hypothetical protein